MSNPRFSIVTPSFEQVNYLPDNIASVERQQAEQLEHIILDGGSDDGTVRLIESYEERASHEVQWRSAPDDGQSAAINEGFERASGDIVGWLNSDDVYLDTTVLSRVAHHFEETGADVVYGDLAYVDGQSRITELDVRPDFDPSKLSYRILVGQPATFFRSDVVKEERLDTSLRFCMDYEFWVRLAGKYDVRHVRDVLAGFRRHEEQKTEDMDAVGREVERMLSRYNEQLPPPARNVLLDNALTEFERLLAGGLETIRMHRSPPTLAFDGVLAPLPEMLVNLGPGRDDVRKAFRRWRS